MTSQRIKHIIICIISLIVSKLSISQTSTLFGLTRIGGDLSDAVGSYIKGDYEHAGYLLENSGYVLMNAQPSGFMNGKYAEEILEFQSFDESSPFWGKLEMYKIGSKINISYCSIGLSSAFDCVGFEKVFLPLSVSRLYYGGNHGDGWGTDGNEKYLQQLYQLWTKITGEDPNGFNIPLRLVEHNTQPSNYTTINLASGKSVVNGIINQKFVEDALGREPNRPYQLALYSDKKSDEYINIWAGEPTDQLYTVGVPQALKSVFDNTGYKYRFDMNGSLTPFDWTLLFDITDECFITIPIVPNYGLMMIGAHLGGKDINFVLDTGASITTLNESRKDDLIASRSVIATSRNIETIDAEGELTQHKIYLIRELEIASSNGKFLYNDIEIVFTGGENLLGANVWENWKDFGINQEDNYILIKQ